MAGAFFQQYSKQSLPFPLTLSGCDLYLDADNPSNDNSRWYDQSTNNWSFTKTGVQPQLTPNVLNGKSGYVFASNTYFSGGDILDLHTGGFSMFIVYKSTSAGFVNIVGKTNFVGDGGEYSLGQTDVNTPYSFLNLGGGIVVHATGSFNQSNFLTASIVMDRSVLSNNLYANGNQIGQTNNFTVVTDLNNTSNFMIGARSLGNYAFAGTICMIIRYNRALTPTERGQVEAFLRTKYNHY